MTIYNFKLLDINNNEVLLSQYKNKVILIVNVASKCGFTKQYEQLEQLYQKYKDKDFIILGFPCRQFFFQEFENNEQIKRFCSTKYNVTFPLFSIIDVRGKNQSELYKYLIENKPYSQRGKAIRWNFEKFLIDKNGNIVNRYESKFEPLEIINDIEKLIK